MEDIQVFNNPEFGEIRTMEINDEPWFVANDVAKALGYSNPRDAIAKHVDEEDKGVANRDTLGGIQEMTIINESGLYSLVLSSKLPSAKKFKRWITHDVVPSIRKHGAYMTQQTISKALTSPDFLIQLATQLKEEQTKRAQLESKITEQAPKVTFANAILGSKNSCLVGELAKMLTNNCITIGQNRLFKWLREHHFLGTTGERYNIPNQEYVEQGLFELKKTVHDENGVMVSKVTPKVTAKDQQYFINGFLDGKFKLA